ncbi:MAG: oligopeptide/dipeptide ABC transporter ATP-binding protein, partial [Bacillota bacterium]
AKAMCRNMQMIFQDPYSSLNPRKDIRGILSEPYLVQKLCKGAELEKRIREVCSNTGISEEDLQKFPHELDGGKRQMVGIARALSLNPKFIVCDEPVSALDVSVQARIINLLMELQKKFGFAYLFVSHDLSVVRHISNRIAVMYLGKIVEMCDCDELFENPKHPYTIALLSAIPTTDIDTKMNRIILKGDVPSPINPKPGCRFAGRCYKAQDICFKENPAFEEKESNHYVACHFVEKCAQKE